MSGLPHLSCVWSICIHCLTEKRALLGGGSAVSRTALRTCATSEHAQSPQDMGIGIGTFVLG